jgi:hypothetical protein
MVTGRSFVIALFTVTGFVSMPAFAQPAGQSAPPGCRAWDVDLSSQWSPWAERATPVAAAATIDGLGNATIEAARKVSVMLHPAGDVRMAMETPEVDAPPNAHKGLLSVRVPSDGYYWVGVSTGLWIDVVQSGAIVMSGEFGPGPLCASMRKTVQFMLKAGDAVIQLSDNRGSNVDLVFVRQP